MRELFSAKQHLTTRRDSFLFIKLWVLDSNLLHYDICGKWNASRRGDKMKQAKGKRSRTKVRWKKSKT